MQDEASIYRQEALRHYTQARREGRILRISPGWTGWVYWVLLAVLASGLLYGLVATLDEYAAGPAVIRFDGRVELTSHEAGLVSAVAAQPGQLVRAGQPLVTLASQEESAAVERLRHQHELQLARFLREPSDAAAAQALTAALQALELTEARLGARALRAPCDGVVTDVRVLPGQYLTPGASALSLIPADASPSLLILLPGHARPHLRPGTPLRAELEGFRHEYQQLLVEQVGDQIIGPTEARRFLGPGLSDAFALSGPLVLVRARLPSRTFHSQGSLHPYFDGMPARAEARVRSERLLFLLFPGLHELLSFPR